MSTFETRDTLISQAERLHARAERKLARTPGAGPSITRVVVAADLLSCEIRNYRRNPSTSTTLIRRMDELHDLLETRS